MMATGEIERARAALYTIPPDLPRDDWVKVAMAAQAAGLTFDTFNDWSAHAENYDHSAARDVWKSIKPGKGVGAGTLFHMGRAHGWGKGGHTEAKPLRPAPAKRAAKPVPREGMTAAELWERFEPATAAHPYIVAKAAEGVPLQGLRMVPDADPLQVAGERMAGALVVPVLRDDGTPSSLQFIAPPEAAERLNAKGKPGKLNLAGARLEGWFTVGELLPGGSVHLCEGIGQAWACWKATGCAAVVCFGWGRVRAVAEALRQRDPTARMVLVPDVGKEESAEAIARAAGLLVATMPEGWPRNADVNDLMRAEGADIVADLLEHAKPPKAASLPLGVVFADELPSEYEAPDELVQGVLTAGAGSMLYGDSNSGKTFFTIDLACAVARGVPWMGRRTEQGLVVYVAAESPTSVRSRLQAYQMHHRCTVPNFAIVQEPLDLFSGDADTEALIALVRQMERDRYQKVRLIVGDTLARLSAGANENSGEHMGMVVKRFDRVRAECDAHFLLIHHSGKAAANGARGWSGIRAAMDTEIEVTEGPTGRCAEITKSRDLGTKGERIGFKLEPIQLGVTKWGAPASSCAVLPTDAPAKPAGRRMGEVEGAVVEYLASVKHGIKKSEVVKHFEGRYQKGPIYRAMKALVSAQAIHEAAGMVTISEAAK